LHLHAGALGRWLGIFAIAMLFIGPPIGQWTAAQQANALQEWDAFCGDLSKLAASSGHSHQHADAHAHDQSPAVSGKSNALTQVGVLSLDHCGYCDLAACFAALPGTWAGVPLLDWGRVQPLVTSYQAPDAPYISTRQARAPPLFHA
jgi:hypothetical protein